jgi:hypothetical protein
MLAKHYHSPLLVCVSIFLMATLLFSCHSEDKEIITRKIQYDVNLKSPHPDYDWWIQNIAGPQREKLLQTIIRGALAGKYNTFNYFFQPIGKQEIAHILSDTLALKVRETKPPYALTDTLIISHIALKDILRLRFLEEWQINPKNMQFTKTVIGIAPIARRLDEEGKIRWQPLFWIIPDKKKAKELQAAS